MTKQPLARAQRLYEPKWCIELWVAYPICEPRAIGLWADVQLCRRPHTRPLAYRNGRGRIVTPSPAAAGEGVGGEGQPMLRGQNLEVDDRLVLARDTLEDPVVYPRPQPIGWELQAVGLATWANVIGPARAEDRTIGRGQPETQLLVGLEAEDVQAQLGACFDTLTRAHPRADRLGHVGAHIRRRRRRRGTRAHLVAQQPQQHVVGRLVLRVQLEARALEPLHRVAPARRVLDLRLGERQAEQRQVLGLTLAPLAVELQPAGAPRLENVTTDIVASLGEEAAARLGAGLGEGEPVAALLLEAVDAEATE